MATEMYFDESGQLGSREVFVAGAWMTSHPTMWREIIEEQRHRHRYPYELHFADVKPLGKDKRADTIEGIFKKLLSVRKAWWCRLAIVTPANGEQLRDMPSIDAYDNVVAETMIRFGPHAKSRRATLVLDERSRPWWDNFLPVGLEAHLNQAASALNGPRFTVVHGDSKYDDLLQLADCVVSAVRQMFVPSTNQRKKELSNMLMPLLHDRIGLWEWKP